MSNIVVFQPVRQARPSRAPRQGESAEILFFTGVRYVRALELDELAASGPLPEETQDLDAAPAERLQA